MRDYSEGDNICPAQVILEEAVDLFEAKDEAEAWKELDEMSINELYGVSWEN